MAKEKLYIGSNFGTLNFFNEDGTPLTSAPYVTLHSKEEGKYFVARTQANEDGVTYDAVFQADVTERMTPRLYALEVYDSSAMTNMLYYDEEYAIAIVASSTNSQTEG